MNVRFTGVKEIDNIFRHLPDALTHSVLSAAHFAAAKPLVEREKLLAPEGPTGNLIDSIGAVKLSQKRATVAGEVIVGPRRGGRNKGYAGHLVEFGTKRRKTSRGANRGIMPKQPFAKPAFNQEHPRVLGLLKESYAKSLLRTMRRYNRA